MTEYERYRTLLVRMLESYRDGPEVPLRRYVDRLMRLSLKATVREVDAKKLHNLIVLRYISGTKRAKKPICDALNIGRDNYEAKTAAAIERLLVLAFGVGGINWDGRLPDLTGREQNWLMRRRTPPSDPLEDTDADTLTEQTAVLIRLKYEAMAGFLLELARNIRESAEFSEDERGNVLDAVKTAQVRLITNAAFDPMMKELLFPGC